jgi:hypothetical protein
MPEWIVIGLASASTLSVIAGFVVAAVLRAVGRSVSEMLDFGPTTSVR